MYVPAAFAFPPDSPDAVHRVVTDNPFATLVASGDGGLEAVHVPCLFDPARGPHGTLRAHVARANPVWRMFSDREVLVVFQGPNAYVSPDWYETPGLVPTWNYVAVHAYGVPRILEARTDVLAVLADLSAAHEARLAPKQPWTLDKVPAKHLDALLEAIVAFEIEVTRLDAKRKLSQNRREADIHGVAAALGARDDGRAIAALMDPA